MPPARTPRRPDLHPSLTLDRASGSTWLRRIVKPRALERSDITGVLCRYGTTGEGVRFRRKPFVVKGLTGTSKSRIRGLMDDIERLRLEEEVRAAYALASDAPALRRAVRLYRAAARVAAAELPEGSVGRSLLVGAMAFHDEEALNGDG